MSKSSQTRCFICDTICFANTWQCEALAHETGCWIFFGAQHSTARGGALTYVSPKLVYDAGSTANQLGTIFSTKVQRLIKARRDDGVKLQEEYEAAQELLRQKNEEIESLKARIDGITPSPEDGAHQDALRLAEDTIYRQSEELRALRARMDNSESNSQV